MKQRNRLWKPEGTKPHFGIRLAKRDPLCDSCPNKTIHYKDSGKDKTMPCRGLCPPMTWINGNTPTKEALLTDINTKDMEYRDYKDELAELIEDRQIRVDKIIGIENLKQRAIAILLLAKLTKKDIADLFSMSYRQIGRISKQSK